MAIIAAATQQAEALVIPTALRRAVGAGAVEALQLLIMAVDLCAHADNEYQNACGHNDLRWQSAIVVLQKKHRLREREYREDERSRPKVRAICYLVATADVIEAITVAAIL